jgi:hypothetical protein
LLNHSNWQAIFWNKRTYPLIAGLVNSNLAVFVTIKMSVTVCVGLVLVLAERFLIKSKDLDIKSNKTAHNALSIAYASIIIFFTLVVLSNVFVNVRLM